MQSAEGRDTAPLVKVFQVSSSKVSGELLRSFVCLRTWFIHLRRDASLSTQSLAHSSTHINICRHIRTHTHTHRYILSRDSSICVATPHPLHSLTHTNIRRHIHTHTHSYQHIHTHIDIPCHVMHPFASRRLILCTYTNIRRHIQTYTFI